MDSHKITSLTLKRGDAAKLDRAQGLVSDGEHARSYMRPLAGGNNLNTGRLSPAARTKNYLRALSTVNPQGARLEAFDMLSIVEESHPADSPEQAALAVVRGALEAISGLLTPGLSPDEREAKVLVGGAGFLAARVFVSQQPDPDQPSAVSNQVYKIAA